MMGGVKGEKMKRTGGRAKTSRDVRHGVRHALEIGPRRSDLSYPHARYKSEGDERTNGWMDRQTDGRTGRKKERDSGNRVMSIAIYRPTLFPAFGEFARERDEYRRYFSPGVFLSIIATRNRGYLFAGR